MELVPLDKTSGGKWGSIFYFHRAHPSSTAALGSDTSADGVSTSNEPKTRNIYFYESVNPLTNFTPDAHNAGAGSAKDIKIKNDDA